jgi:hypothetical protein
MVLGASYVSEQRHLLEAKAVVEGMGVKDNMEVVAMHKVADPP